MTLEAASGVVPWIPVNGQKGPHDVTVQVADAQGGLDVQTVIVTVAV